MVAALSLSLCLTLRKIWDSKFPSFLNEDTILGPWDTSDHIHNFSFQKYDIQGQKIKAPKNTKKKKKKKKKI